jgi:hypothetical protein
MNSHRRVVESNLESNRALPRLRIGLHLGALVLALIATALWLTQLTTPILSWDEGWTLLVARTWLESGHYGRELLGAPASPGLAASFPNVVLTTLGLRLFGLSPEAGRLPMALFSLLALALLLRLAGLLYGRAGLWATLFAVLLLPAHLATNVVYIGRQVFAEPLQLTTLLAGYLGMYAVLNGRPLWLPLVCLSWGLALIAKAQTMPFWLVSLLLPLLFTLWQRHWRPAGWLAALIAGSFLARFLLNYLIAAFLHDHSLATEPLAGLTQAVALTLAPEARTMALMMLIVTGLPTVVGLSVAGWHFLRSWRRQDWSAADELLRLALLVLVGSWMAWYILFSVGWARYLYPPVFIGSIFAGAWLAALIRGCNPGQLVRELTLLIRRPRRQRLGLFVALLFLLLLPPITFNQQLGMFRGESTATLEQTVAWLHANSPNTARVESYDSEVFFLLDRLYHYPPDQINVDLIRTGDLGENLEIEYDPLAADPDYLIMGPFSRASQLYDQAIAVGDFQSVQRYGSYEIFARVR